jgi:hypothetical protein
MHPSNLGNPLPLVLGEEKTEYNKNLVMYRLGETLNMLQNSKNTLFWKRFCKDNLWIRLVIFQTKVMTDSITDFKINI